eukprot:m.263873 g.263873  ORF g.263873 m.263873 type:complete len:101 (-) comp54650_c0_seq6:860-1162(-)
MENTDMENSESRDPISDLPSSSSQSSSLDAQVNQLLQLVRQASHIVCYTGAGFFLWLSLFWATLVFSLFLIRSFIPLVWQASARRAGFQITEAQMVCGPG